jgi:hypothetical protein
MGGIGVGLVAGMGKSCDKHKQASKTVHARLVVGLPSCQICLKSDALIIKWDVLRNYRHKREGDWATSKKRLLWHSVVL